MTTDLNKIVGNFRDILGKLRDNYTLRCPTLVKDAHISIHIHMYRRAIPFRGIDSQEKQSAHAGAQRKMRRFGQIDKAYWWITAHAEAEEKTALIPIALARKESDFSRVRQ